MSRFDCTLERVLPAKPAPVNVPGWPLSPQPARQLPQVRLQFALAQCQHAEFRTGVFQLGHGAEKVFVCDSSNVENFLNASWSALIVEARKQSGADIVLMKASELGKALAPKVAGKLGAGAGAI